MCVIDFYLAIFPFYFLFIKLTTNFYNDVCKVSLHIIFYTIFTLKKKLTDVTAIDTRVSIF